MDTFGRAASSEEVLNTWNHARKLDCFNHVRVRERLPGSVFARQLAGQDTISNDAGPVGGVWVREDVVGLCSPSDSCILCC